MRILVVEDNDDLRALMRRVLERDGHEVTVASDGEAGLALLNRILPDVVLMDIALPGISGTEAVGRIKADPARAATPVIALTAHALEGERERCLAAGFDEYEAKPIDWPRLKEKIAALGSR